MKEVLDQLPRSVICYFHLNEIEILSVIISNHFNNIAIIEMILQIQLHTYNALLSSLSYLIIINTLAQRKRVGLILCSNLFILIQYE